MSDLKKAVDAMSTRLGLTDPKPQQRMAVKAAATKQINEERMRKPALMRALETRQAIEETIATPFAVMRAQRRLDNETIKHKLRGELVYKHAGPNRRDKKILRLQKFAGPVPKNKPYRKAA